MSKKKIEVLLDYDELFSIYNCIQTDIKQSEKELLNCLNEEEGEEKHKMQIAILDGRIAYKTELKKKIHEAIQTF